MRPDDELDPPLCPVQPHGLALIAGGALLQQMAHRQHVLPEQVERRAAHAQM